jgi:hypothetical protein
MKFFPGVVERIVGRSTTRRRRRTPAMRAIFRQRLFLAGLGAGVRVNGVAMVCLLAGKLGVCK